MKRKLIFALVGLVTITVIFVVGQGNIDYSGPKDTKADSFADSLELDSPESSLEDYPQEKSTSDIGRTERNGDEVKTGSVVKEEAEGIDSINDLADAESDVMLSYDTQEYIQAIAYEVAALPSISDVAYMDKLNCGDTGCEVEMKFFDSRMIARKSSALLAEINDRLKSNSATSHLQFGITTMAFGEDGIGKLDLVVVPRRENSFAISIVEDIGAPNR